MKHPDMKVTDVDLKQRRIALNARIEAFLQTLTRDQRRKVRKHMASGMELKDALTAIGYIRRKTEDGN